MEDGGRWWKMVDKTNEKVTNYMKHKSGKRLRNDYILISQYYLTRASKPTILSEKGKKPFLCLLDGDFDFEFKTMHTGST